MQKNYFHNGKPTYENEYKKKTFQFQNIDRKTKVDINKLLNRVRIEERSGIKQKIIFSSLIIISICLLATYSAFIK